MVILCFAVECEQVLKRNKLVGDIETWFVSVKAGRTIVREITMRDGRVFKFSNSGLIKKDKVETRKQRRAKFQQRKKLEVNNV